MPVLSRLGVAATLLLGSHLAHAADLPADVLRQVPAGYQPLAQLQPISMATAAPTTCSRCSSAARRNAIRRRPDRC